MLNNQEASKTWDLQVSNFAGHFSTFDLKISQTFRLHLSSASLPSQLTYSAYLQIFILCKIKEGKIDN